MCLPKNVQRTLCVELPCAALPSHKKEKSKMRKKKNLLIAMHGSACEIKCMKKKKKKTELKKSSSKEEKKLVPETSPAWLCVSVLCVRSCVIS